MSQLDRAGAASALGLSLMILLLGAVAGCGGDDSGAGAGAPTAEPGQSAVPGTDAGGAETGDAPDVPVDPAPAEPGAGA